MASSRASRPLSRVVRQAERNSITLPVDILLKIFSTLSISDIMNIRQTCKHFYEVSKLRSLWHLLLRRHVLQINLPIPGLGDRSIDSLSSNDLERCTFRALRLRSVWTTPSCPTAKKIFISPIPDGQTRNSGLQFLPGRDQRWLLSITAVASDRSNWFAMQCWDVNGRRPACVARRRFADLASFAVNTDHSSQAVLALLVPQSVSSNDPNGIHKLTRFCSIEIYAINFAANRPESAFVCTTSFHRRRYRQLHVFSGSDVLCQSLDGHLIYWNTNTPDTEAEFRDTSPHLERCLGAIIHNDFAMVIRACHFQLYPLGPYRVAANSRTRTCVIHPVALHRWRWQVSSACMNLAMPPSTTASVHGPHPPPPAFPAITALIRFKSMGGWPDNVLHHFVVRPNPAFSRSGTVDAHNVPYLPPWLVQPFASPVLIHATTHSALNRYGKAVWIDNHVENPSGPEWINAQRITGELLVDDGSVSDDTARSAVMARRTFSLQPSLAWLHVALDDTGSQIATGSTDGKINVFQYA